MGWAWKGVLWGLIAVMGVAGSAGAVTRTMLPREDLSVVSPLVSTASGCTLAVLQTAVTAIGSAEKTLVLSPVDGAGAGCTWAITDNLTVPANVTLWVPSGAAVSVSSGKTLTLARRPVVDGQVAWYSGDGAVSITPPDVPSSVVAPFVRSGCLPTVPAPASLTLDAFGCTAFVVSPEGDGRMVTQAAVAVGPLNNGDGTYWLALHWTTSGTVSGWTRQGTTKYLWQKSATQPSTPSNGLIIARIVVSGSVVTETAPVAARDPLPKSGTRIADIRHYGATPDDNTDDDRVAIQAAMDAGLPEVYIPKGTYDLSCTSNVGVTVSSNTRIYGPGTLKWKSSTANSCRMLHISGKTNVVVEGIELDGNGNNAAAGQQNHGIHIKAGSTDITVRDVRLHDHQGDAIYIGSTDASTVTERIMIINSRWWNTGRQGLTVADAGTRYLTITGNQCRAGTRVTTSTSDGNCIHLETDAGAASYVGNNVIVSQNTMLGSGVSFSATEGDPWQNIVIADNTIEHTDGAGVGSPSGIWLVNVAGATITGNVISANSGAPLHAIHIQDPDSTSDTGRVVVSNNHIIGSAFTADIVSIHGATTAKTAGNLLVTNNQIWTTAAAGDCIEISLVTQNVIISNNVMRGCAGSAIAFRGGAYFQISGNIIKDPGAAAILAFSNTDAVAKGLIYGNVIEAPGVRGVHVLGSGTPVNQVLVFGNMLSDAGTPLDLEAAATETYGALNYTAAGIPGTDHFLTQEETITAGATITANACGGIKRVTAAGAVTTNTGGTFTAPSVRNAGCMMTVYNSGGFDITLDANSAFDTLSNADVVLASGCSVEVFSTGASGKWVQRTAMLCAS